MMHKRDPNAHLSGGGIRSLLLSSSPCELIFFGHFESDVGVELGAEFCLFPLLFCLLYIFLV